MRKAKVDAHLEKLGASSDVLCLQETQLLELDHDSLGHSLDSFIFFYNNAPFGLKGGVATGVSRAFASGYSISQVGVGPGVEGRVLVLKFTSLLFPSVGRASFYVVNVYLQSGGKNVVRLQQLASIRALDPGVPMFLLGDFNMVVFVYVFMHVLA